MSQRTDKILKLVAVGFSATELSQTSSEALEKTFQAAIPLMEEKERELKRVLNREDARSMRLKALIARRDHNRQIESEWVRNWKPLPPIRTVDTSIDDVLRKIASHRSDYERSKELFRSTGHQRHAHDAQNSLQAMKTQEGHLLHLVEMQNGNNNHHATSN